MDLSASSLGEDFHLHFQCLLILVMLLCRRAETLSGSGLRKSLGRYLALLE